MTTAAVAAAAIELRSLMKDYGAVKALQGLDLEVPPGSVFGFLGPNGAGKTTALSILVGLADRGGGAHPPGATPRVRPPGAVRPARRRRGQRARRPQGTTRPRRGGDPDGGPSLARSERMGDAGRRHADSVVLLRVDKGPPGRCPAAPVRRPSATWVCMGSERTHPTGQARHPRSAGLRGKRRPQERARAGPSSRSGHQRRHRTADRAVSGTSSGGWRELVLLGGLDVEGDLDLVTD